MRIYIIVFLSQMLRKNIIYFSFNNVAGDIFKKPQMVGNTNKANAIKDIPLIDSKAIQG